MADTIQYGYTRRQELVCTVQDITNNPDKILLENEVLLVNQGNNTYKIKIGDGTTTVSNLPYITIA